MKTVIKLQKQRDRVGFSAYYTYVQKYRLSILIRLIDSSFNKENIRKSIILSHIHVQIQKFWSELRLLKQKNMYIHRQQGIQCIDLD